MRKRCWSRVVMLVTLCFVATGSAQEATSGDQFVGTWIGTWEGAGSGGFELTLEKGQDGAVAGRVSVTGEPAYKATFKSLSFDGKKMTAKYDFPPDPAAEVVLTAAFDGNSAAGAWSLVERASGNEVISGTWSVKRK